MVLKRLIVFIFTLVVVLVGCSGMKRSGPESPYDKAVRLEKLRDTSAAIPYYQKAIRKGDRVDLAYANLGEIYYHQDNYDKATNLFTRAINRDPGNPWFRNLRGRTHYKADRHDMALRDFDYAMQQEFHRSQYGIRVRRTRPMMKLIQDRDQWFPELRKRYEEAALALVRRAKKAIELRQVAEGRIPITPPAPPRQPTIKPPTLEVAPFKPPLANELTSSAFPPIEKPKNDFPPVVEEASVTIQIPPPAEEEVAYEEPVSVAPVNYAAVLVPSDKDPNSSIETADLSGTWKRRGGAGARFEFLDVGGRISANRTDTAQFKFYRVDLARNSDGGLIGYATFRPRQSDSDNCVGVVRWRLSVKSDTELDGEMEVLEINPDSCELEPGSHHWERFVLEKSG